MDRETNPYAAPRSRLEQRPGPVPRRDYPWWIKASLWGVPGRAGLWAFVVVSLAAAGGCAIYGYWDRRFFSGTALLFAALMYWLSIRWVDRHGSWTDAASVASPSRPLVVGIKACLAIAGLWMLDRTERAAPNVAFHQGQVLGKAIGGMILLIAAIPWRGPGRSASDAPEEL